MQVPVERGLRGPDVQHTGHERREKHEELGLDENHFSAGIQMVYVDQRQSAAAVGFAFYFIKIFPEQTGGLKVNLGENKRIKINGQRVSVPYKRSNELTISNMNETVLVETRIGVSIVWDGRGFLEVSVPSRYKGKKNPFS